MKQKSMRVYLILLLLIVAACSVIFWKNLSYHYEMRGEQTELSGVDMEISGYDVSAAGGGIRSFTVTGEDPQFLLIFPAGGALDIGGIELIFEQGGEHESQKALPVQVFYAKEGTEFKERHSVKRVLEAGRTSLVIPVPQGRYETLRFDIDGDFRLAGIYSCSEPVSARAYVSQKTVNASLWYFPAVIIGFCLIFWAHGERIRKGKFTKAVYAREVFLGAEPSAGREGYLDYLRVLAAVLVILAHSCSPMVDRADAGWKRLVLVCGLSLGLCCNILYVMLSGTLLLGGRNNRDEGVVTFYVRRASKVIIPLVAYYLLLLFLNGEVSFLPPENIGVSFLRIAAGAPDAGPHLWLIYTIVALYLVTPFFRVMVQHMGDRLLFALAVVILVLNALTTYLPLFGTAFGATSFLAGWEGIFLLGYILTRQNGLQGATRRNRILLSAAAVCYIVMAAAVFADSSNMNYVYGSTPTITVASCGIFVLFLTNKNRFQGKVCALVRMCSKYSYSIILIHWYALFVVVQGKLHITALRFGCLGGIAASVAVTFAVCLAMAVVYDNTVVVVCSVIFDKLTARLTKSFEE